MKNNYQKGYVVPLIIAIVVLVLGGSYVYYKTQSNKAKSNLPADLTDTTIVTTSSDQTSDWKTYKNDKFGFSFEYPDTWAIQNKTDDSSGVTSGVIFNSPQGTTLLTVNNPIREIGYEGGTAIKNEKIVIGGQSFTKVTLKNENNNVSIHLTWNKSNWSKSGEIWSLSKGNDADTILNRILSTFKFTSSDNAAAEIVPYIGSITPQSASIGSTIEIRGSDLAGFEGDVYFFFKRSDGKIVRLPGILSTQTVGDAKGAQTVRIVLREPCQQGQTVYGDYSGIPSICDYVALTPGVYTVYTTPWGKVSNKVTFTVTGSDSTFNWKLCTNNKYGYELKYPENWKVWEQGSGTLIPASCADNHNLNIFSPDKSHLSLNVDVMDSEQLKGGVFEGIKSIDEMFSKNPQIAGGNPIVKNSIIDGEKLVWLKNRYLYAFHNGSIFRFETYNITSDTLNQILSTFKFTN